MLYVRLTIFAVSLYSQFIKCPVSFISIFLAVLLLLKVLECIQKRVTKLEGTSYEE